ncbi:uncharacterized protein LOC143429775 [Xylocopa sonorina]|uniref:uncharacterized protein LOC143429775 n=1 Tax=Xylocopa sonorina TaxID=1818115 RepID=UPI00403B1326
MDEYDKKFAEMQKYIPFLEAMIERLQNVKDKSREVQLQKMQSLHGILSNSKRKLKIETLQRCEDVLQKLHNKVEKGNTPGLHFPHKKNDASATQSSNTSEDTKSQHVEDAKYQHADDAKPSSSKETEAHRTEHALEDGEIHETPASPSPPVSPDSGSQVAPIIIPTERKIDFDDKLDSKPASPDPIDTLPTKAPIIIPTERTSNDLTLSPQHGSCKSADDVSFSEWDMLEENENQIVRNKNWQTIVSSGHDVSSAVKMVGNSLPQKVNDGRTHAAISMHSSRQIPTVPVPSLGGSRRLSSILEKNRLVGVNLDQVPSDSRPESPVSVSEVRLKSPDVEILFPKHGKNTPPRPKDNISRPNSKPSAPLLLSPPASTEPPLSMEDLAELLNEGGDNKAEKKSDRLTEDPGKLKKDKQDLNAMGGTNNDGKSMQKSFLLTQEDIDSESERRWEEIDKHIVKLTSRKCLPNSSTSKVDSMKSSETKGPSQGSLGHGSSSFATIMPVDNRNQPSSPGSKMEPRFADNYERHPRQLRDNHGYEKDKANVHNMHCRADDDMPNQMPLLHSGPAKPDDRNVGLYQRRQGNVGPEMPVPPRIDTEFRMEGPEYFNRQVPNQSHWPPMHPAVNTNEFCNNQWPPPSNFSGMPNSPAQTYRHPMGMHEDMWNVAANREPIHMDPHQMNEGQVRPNQFPGSINAGIRPLMSLNTTSQDISHIPRPDEMLNVDVPNVPVIASLTSPTRFPVAPPYRNFQGENRPYDQSFDRGMEYPHQRQSWDSPSSRSTDVPYRAENEVTCGVMGPTEGPPGPYSRPSTPCPWNRDRDRGSNRGRNTYYNERSRGEPRNTFNRDTRRPEWTRDHNEWDNCNRFGRDARNISDRDPRIRMEHGAINQSPNQPRDNGTSVRDPRLAKDKHFPTGKGKDGGFNERDPRKRSTTPAFVTSSFRKSKDKVKSSTKSADGHRRADMENGSKQTQEKSGKDKMQSPLESLYGVIDTKAKSAQGYCLQNFKIPKIKRNESSESPTSSHNPEEVDKYESKIKKKEKEDVTAEVSSSSDGNILLEDWSGDNNVVPEKKEEPKEVNTSTESTEEKNDVNVNEPDAISTTSTKLPENVEKSKKDEVEPEGSKTKDEVTQEWIEALIRKSFEFGEGKKFVEQAKFMQKLGEVLQTKKLKIIKKIIESDSESSSSGKDNTHETKKVRVKKKRRVIVSDSSDDESLAERLGILSATSKDSIKDTSVDKKEKKEETSKTVEEKTCSAESTDLSEKDANAKDATILEETPSVIEEQEKPKDDKTNIVKEEENVLEICKKEIKEEPTEDKEAISKAPKVRTKRRNSLEMLQEDIREMFISDGVVAATGHRLCRTQKENNPVASTSNQNAPVVKKDDSTKREVDMDSDAEDTVVPPKQKKPIKLRCSDESSKPRGKPKREVQRITRQRSKQYTLSSDSEEDQPLALRTELVQSISSTSTQEACSDESEVLRRSKRIINKETIREPRVVVEKTDISKLEFSKVMFDSSSDESFGIDVSELAAAVDISLHPDKQPEPEPAEPVEKKKYSPTSSRKSTRKRTGETTNESKDDGQFSDEESIISDISMSSSVASAKKTTSSSSKTETSGNEELLSNILFSDLHSEIIRGLEPSKNNTDKDSLIVDKGSDADVDDDIGEVPVELNTKKFSGKKKKKKCNWQMGILSKKKKKKATLAALSPKGDSDPHNVSSEMETSTKTSTSSVLEDVASKDLSDDINQTVLEESCNKVKDVDRKQITDDDSKQQKSDESSNSSNSVEKKEASCKISGSEEPLEVKDNKRKDKLASNAEKSTSKCKEDPDKSYNDLDIKKLIDYVWTGQERYKCLLCFFTGKNIVHHYKLNHPGKEILISRLKASDAKLAIQDAKDSDLEKTSTNPVTEETCKFRCRFCSLFTEGAAKVAMEAFYEHCTTHTGEYRFRCNSCPYQAVAKSSMRTHYYKVCRKFKDTFVEAITEDEIPDENCICGYLCSNCNYIQLKRSNVKQHIDLWHKHDSNVEIIKINMSLNSIEEETDKQIEVPEKKVKVEELVLSTGKIEGSANNPVTSVVDNDDEVIEIEDGKENKISDNEDKKGKDVPAVQPHEEKDQLVPQQIVSDEKKKSPSTDTDSSLSTGNLSVFVCPPELEKKEVEIQLERKRKMQEIIQNIGIKLQKDSSKKGLSIIDKLKDKMKTNVVTIGNETDSNVAPDSQSKISTDSIIFPSTTPSDCNAVELLSNTNVPTVENLEANLLSLQENSDEKGTDEDSTSKMQPSSAECESQPTPKVNLVESQVRDPLATLDQKKSDKSDGEISDNENMRDAPPIFDSDSSSEQSDGELPTDVNMILKETSSINAPFKDSMLTTIQRLAAQLQATKPLETCKDKASPNSEGQNAAFPTDHIPKPPDVVPIASIKKFVGKMQNRFHEISNELQDDSNPPKNFIRLRRLSGDMLSVPVQSSSDQEGLPVSTINVSESTTSEKNDSQPRSDGEEECSFLKIENVVSLAPRADSDSTESPIINDIRKAVETSPMKSKGVSLLKKSNSPLILKRLNSVTIAQPLTKNIQTVQSTPEALKLIPMKSLSPAPVSVTTTQLTANFIPIAPKSKIIQVDNKLSFPITTTKSTVVNQANTRTVTVTGSPQPSNLNYKILKVVRTPAIKPTVTPIIKPKEMAMKLKSTDCYHAMLKASKLVQLYKCMARECRFTTDTLAQYHQHYIQHTIEVEKRNMLPPYDFQKCAYCYTTLEDWTQLKTHMDEKHAYCRYQCMYCFYRAIVPSYVQIHQMLSHPGHRGILLGKQMKEIPLKKDINRHEFVYPYVCQNGFLDCGKFFYVPESFMAHLKNKHSTLTATYKCHVCRATFRKVQQLIPHYKMHGFNKYQCLYCLHGSDSFNDMHNHLSAHHYNRLPQTLERSLPPKAVRNKDVIDQLIIRTLDETFKMTEEVVDVENDGKDGTIQVLIDRSSTISSSPAQKLFRPILPKDVTILNKEENELLNKSICSLFGTGNTSNSPINATFTLQEKSLNESSNDSASSKPFGNLVNDSDVSIISNKESSEKSLLDTPKKSLLAKSPTEPMDPSEGSFDCSDEFININLLDNPDFLKKVSNCSTDVSTANKSTVDDSKQDDSDIEIVDVVDREVVSAKSIKSECDRKESGDLNSKSKVESEVDMKEQQSCNVDVKDLNVCTDTNKDSSDTTKTDKPLTLEDIKDTGFSGTKLYKCGYETCDFSAPSAAHLRTHVKECSLGGDSKNLACAHCGKRFMKVGFLLEHIKSHGLKRFGCALCKMRCTVGYQAMAHMKMKHKYGCSKLVPADPKNPSADGLFIVQPISQSGERKGKKRKTGTKISEKEPTEKVGTDPEKLTFSPDEIEALPRQAIYNREVQCAVCPYTTKVRMNIIRHLQLHAKDESVPESGPVNPVPCLDKKERMFDKMVNLASSSHQNGRMGGKPKEANKNNDDEFIPKFVPEHKRYVCGVAECNYLTVDEAMLRCHFKALHSEEQYFRCPHCPQPPPGQEGLNIAIDKMAVHLKMHDTRLYKCSHCNHHHYHRHVVERHLSDKHPEKRPFVKVIRELENTENNQQSVQEEIEEELPDPDGNHWKCNVCDYKCVYKAEMVNHTTVTHDEKCQYKCSSCSFKTSGKIMFEQHVNSKHSNDPNVDYVLMYQRIKGINKKNTDNVEQGGQDEPFDTTPLWRRDMPRIRHIRGILLEEEDEVATESNLKTAKRKSDVDVSSARPAKIKPGKSGSLDDAKQTKEKSKRSLSCDKVSTEVESVADNTPSTVEKPKETKIKLIEDNDSNESDVGRFGPYGKADGNMYVCTLCTQFKTKYKHDMRDHLYRELNYARWHCKDCGYLSVNRNALLKHFNKHHNGERPNHEPLSPDNDIEEWVGTLLRRQTSMIKGLLAKQSTSNAESSTTTNSIETKPIPTKSTQSTVSKTSKVASVIDKPVDMQDNKSKKTTNVEVLDGNSKDNDTLSVHANDDNTSKKDETEKITDADKAEPEEEQEKPLTCKHCNMTFSRWRGFKLHVQLTHLKRLGFICPYCDRSTNSEGLMRQHIRSRHPGFDEKIVQNPAAGGPELPEEFWQQEYGIVFPKRNRKRKRRISGEEVAEKSESQAQIEPQEKCNMCDFTSTSTTGLKIHMRTHTARNILKCCYCSFSATTNSEMWDHWEVNHPFTPYKVEEIPNDLSAVSVNVESDKKPIEEDYSNDIVEEEIPDTRQKEAIYYCYYCSFRSKFLDVVQSHWSTEHHQSSLSDDSTSTVTSSCPFRYKEVSVSTVKSLLKGQSSRTENPYEMYLPHDFETIGIKDDGWICQWCNELCDSEVQMKTHHSMFHSHLPLNFKQHEKSKLSRGYKCPECTFTTTFINVMKNHVSNHISLFKCKYCKKTCGSPREVSNHSVKEHPDMEVKIESIENYEELLEDIMSKVRWYKWHGHNIGKTEDWLASATKTQKAVARKSTARNAFRPSIIPHRINAVAKKSTNPHSRYLISNRQVETKSKQFSYYGAPKSPVNLTKLNTYMVVGGHRMKVNCTTLAQLININPKIVLKDLKYDINNLATLKKLK